MSTDHAFVKMEKGGLLAAMKVSDLYKKLDYVFDNITVIQPVIMLTRFKTK